RSFQWVLLGICLTWVGQQIVVGYFAIEEAKRYKDAWSRFVAGDWTPDMLHYVYPDRERAQAGSVICARVDFSTQQTSGPAESSTVQCCEKHDAKAAWKRSEHVQSYQQKTTTASVFLAASGSGCVNGASSLAHQPWQFGDYRNAAWSVGARH